MNSLKTLVPIGFVAVLGFMTAPVTAGTVNVTNNLDVGSGSFRAAVEAANDDSSITSIHFQAGLGTIMLGSTVTYEGGQPLSIDGQGAVIAPAVANAIDLLLADGGGDLTLRRLTVRDGANGIVVLVPAEAGGQLTVSLFEVTVQDNLLFGLHIDDLTSASGASIGLDIASSRITGNGAGETDRDGVRIDEGGDGDVAASVSNSEITGNGSDGIEVDERGAGSVALFVSGSTFDDNGFQDPADLDDGVDIDEDDDGGVWFRIVNSTFNGNGDDGIDMDESGGGDMDASLVQVDVVGNGDKGVNLAENDAGDFRAQANVILTDGNGFGDSAGDPGLRMREGGAGDFSARVVGSTLSNNDGAGADFRQTGAGTGELRLQAVTFFGNVLGDYINDGGVTVIEVPSS